MVNFLWVLKIDRVAGAGAKEWNVLVSHLVGEKIYHIENMFFNVN